MSEIILKVLPRHPYPPYAGQVRLALNRARELKALGYELHLLSFSFAQISLNEYNELATIFDKIYHIKLTHFEVAISSVRSFLLRFLLGASLQANIFNIQRLKYKLLSILFDDEKKALKTIHFYSIR